jgi:hypothetical protein
MLTSLWREATFSSLFGLGMLKLNAAGFSFLASACFTGERRETGTLPFVEHGCCDYREAARSRPEISPRRCTTLASAIKCNCRASLSLLAPQRAEQMNDSQPAQTSLLKETLQGRTLAHNLRVRGERNRFCPSFRFLRARLRDSPETLP